MRLPTGVMLAIVLSASAAAAPANLAHQSGANTYFNRPGADLATHDGELRQCIVEAARAQDPSAHPAGVLPDLLQEMAGAEANYANIENCMVVRGWRVVAVSTSEYDEISKLDRAAQATRLKNLIGSETPRGMLVRQWANDAADASTIRFELSVHQSGRANLSLTARDRSQDSPPPPPSPLTDVFRNSPTIHPADLAKPLGDQAVIVFTLKGASLHNGDVFAFERMGLEGSARSAKGDDILGIQNPIWEAGRTKVMAFAVHPGRWRLKMIAIERYQLNFCLGSPAFDVMPGKIVYAGTFDLAAPDIGPDFSSEILKSWLGASAEVAASIRPAEFVNGSRGDCAGHRIYALEVKGAPFLEGYEWGSAIRRPLAAVHADPKAEAPSTSPPPPK